jgi:uncharacterized coiled-coil DUF342 family protein
MSKPVDIEVYLSQRITLMRAEITKRQQQISKLSKEIIQLQGSIHELNLLQQNLKRKPDIELGESEDEVSENETRSPE